MKTTKHTVVCVLSFIAAATSLATCDFPYFPEYTDEISKYDEVTILQAKKQAMIFGGVTLTNGVVCEPVLLRAANGMPIGYEVPVYGGNDLAIAKEWNAAASKLNRGESIPAGDFRDLISAINKGSRTKRFDSVFVTPYTFDCGVINAASGSIECFWNYPQAYAWAVDNIGEKGLRFTRIIGSSRTRTQIFEFSNPRGKLIDVYIDEYGKASEANIPGNIEAAGKLAASWYSGIKAQPELIKDCLQGWEGADKSIPDEDAGWEFPRVLSSFGLREDKYGYDSDATMPGVYDPCQNGGSDNCWAWALLARIKKERRMKARRRGGARRERRAREPEGVYSFFNMDNWNFLIKSGAIKYGPRFGGRCYFLI